MNTFEEWKLLFAFHFITFLKSINTPPEHWFSTVEGEISPWVDDELLDWKSTSPADAVKEAISYWEE